jgi:hypothetical protein
MLAAITPGFLTVVGDEGPDNLYDFKNGVYRVDGVSYANAADAGLTGTGTFDANGYTPTGTDSLATTLSLTGDFIVFAKFAAPSTGADRLLWNYTSAANLQVYRSSAGSYRTNPTTADAASASTCAFGRSGGNRVTCWDGGAVSTGAALAAQAAATFRIGNLPGGGFPWTAPIEMVSVYKKTLNAAQIQALN